VNRFFTPTEANALLPEVRALFDQALERHKRMAAVLGSGPESLRARSAEVERLEGEVKGLIEKISALGVEVKGLDQGLLDFPALRDGRPVYLCWRTGDETIEWWHPVSTGFAGRQKLDPAERGRWEWRN
jgi:hypothetical protein